jgi:glycosyltransferase involved in cell wall biosynthesis
MKKISHTFVVCAYKESPYLEECIRSLEAQTVKTNIIIVTSTPCVFLIDIANRHHIELFINPGEGGITQDWNFGLSCVTTKYATIAHQDDTYEPNYLEKIINKGKHYKDNLILFTDYYELRNNEKVFNNLNLKIKRLMLIPLKFPRSFSSIFLRRFVLSFGDPICCPAVTYCLKNLDQPIFNNHFISCEDWEAWEKLSKKKGRFVYISEPLMSHRIHEDSTTSEIINDNGRVDENYEMFLKFWHPVFARILNHFYTKSEKSNNL